MVQLSIFKLECKQSSVLSGRMTASLGKHIAAPVTYRRFQKVQPLRNLNWARSKYQRAVKMFLRVTKSLSHLGTQQEYDKQSSICPVSNLCSGWPVLDNCQKPRNRLTSYKQFTIQCAQILHIYSNMSRNLTLTYYMPRHFTLTKSYIKRVGWPQPFLVNIIFFYKKSSILR